MAKLKTLTLLTLFTLPTFITSCYQNNPEPESKSFLISGDNEFGKTWSISQIDVELGTLIPRTCLTDNFITYFPNGNYEINEGASKCNPGDPPAVVGSWELNDDQTKLSVIIDDSIQVWNVESITGHNQRITSQFNEGLRTYTLTVNQ